MIFNVIWNVAFGFLHILVTIDALCPKLQIDIADIHTYNSNGIYPRRAITRELKRNRIIKRQIMRAKRKMPKISILSRRKREIDINQFFDENPVSRANRFLLKFMGFDMSGGTAIPVEEHLGPPIEISHEEFTALTKKHGKEAEGRVLEISEDEFNALSNKHGGEVEKTVEVVNVPVSSSDVDWQNIPIGEVVDWTPLSSELISVETVDKPWPSHHEIQGGEKSWQNIPIVEPTHLVKQTRLVSVKPANKPSHHEIQDAEISWQNVPIVEQPQLASTETVDKPSHHEIQDGGTSWQNVPIVEQTQLFSIETAGKPSHHEIQDGETSWQNVPIVEQTELHPTITIDQGEWQNVETVDPTESRLGHEWQHPVIRTRPCSSSTYTFVLKNNVNYKNTECWVLPHFKNIYFSYVKCPKTSCSAVSIGHSYACVPSSTKIYNVWFYCKNLGRKIQKYKLKLPQQCECKRYNC